MNVVKRDGSVEPLNIEKIHKVTEWATQGLNVSQAEIETNSHIMFFDGIKSEQIQNALIRSAAELISVEAPDYAFAASRLLLQKIYKEVTGGTIVYPGLRSYVEKGVEEGRLNYELLDFDLEALDGAIRPERDFQFTYLGMQTIYDRYLIRRLPQGDEKQGAVIEMPQHFWMRVALGLALNERPEERTERAKQFYDVLSRFEYVASTPTLFNSGTPRSQMSSCYLNTVADEIGELGEDVGIFNSITECANLSKWAGGIGTDWTRVRGAGDLIMGTGGKSSGVVPYIKIWNDTAVAVNQGGRRNGAFAAYLEPWHPDIFRFCDLKKGSGEERLRARDIFTAVWVNDLFMERVRDGGKWSLISPKKYPELHELHGDAFKRRYEEIEASGDVMRTVEAEELWRHILGALYESGGPWITFKDEANRRNPQDHVGVIHNSNLCTEITLNTSDEETAVCNLGSINMGVCSPEDFKRVIPVAMRMLDNVIDLNFYPSEKARRANMRHRPVGLGIMGWTDYVVRQGVDWESEEHLQLTDRVFEEWSYWAIYGSNMLAQERGAYESFQGSKWSQGILPIDTARELPENWRHRGARMNWEGLRRSVQQHGMRNSNVMAIAPTATIANIAGTTPCIEPVFKLVYSKENHSGLFQVIDPSLRHGRPELCKQAFDIDQMWIIKAAAVRQKWIDQSQSVNLFAKHGTRGRDLSDWYYSAWDLGLKTTYYLRNQTGEIDHKAVVIQDTIKEVAETESEPVPAPEAEPAPKVCSILNPDCESCQ